MYSEAIVIQIEADITTNTKETLLHLMSFGIEVDKRHGGCIATSLKMFGESYVGMSNMAC